MNMEEIVALSVKHNVSDLHLCNAWPARWRIRGKVEIAPFTTPDVENLLMCWLSEQQQVQWQEQGRLILLLRWPVPSGCAPVLLFINREPHWR